MSTGLKRKGTVEKDIHIACTTCFDSFHVGGKNPIRCLDLLYNLLRNSTGRPAKEFCQLKRKGKGQISKVHLRRSFNSQFFKLDLKVLIDKIQQECFNFSNSLKEHNVMITKANGVGHKLPLPLPLPMSGSDNGQWRWDRTLNPSAGGIMLQLPGDIRVEVHSERAARGMHIDCPGFHEKSPLL